ncbi:Hypothetical_protein [Hexamita inflata]|uniref:Hypothetical_protein n=1 Tax=Hexamita inflata TaxID=28002 RepID=A0AA86Q3M4_9EUKA|nr:Hypothetical protein HINF_LOCUS37586 [Hexamita inflata]
MNNSSQVGDIDCVSINSDSIISLTDLLIEVPLHVPVKQHPGFIKPKRLLKCKSVVKQNELNHKAKIGYSIVDAKHSEQMLSVILFASKTKSIDVLFAKTTIRNKRGGSDKFCCCYYQKYKRERVLKKIQEENEAAARLKDQEELFRVWSGSQFQSFNNQNESCKKTRRSFKNKCTKAAGIVIIKGSSILKTKSRYVDRFYYVVDDSNRVGTFSSVKKDQIYYFIQYEQQAENNIKLPLVIIQQITIYWSSVKMWLAFLEQYETHQNKTIVFN